MIKEYLLTSLILLGLDFIYLSSTKKYFNYQVKLVQGSTIKLNILATIACYILLSMGIYYFIIKKNFSYSETFYLGIFVYGVYDLTTMAILKNWKWNTVIMDTLWGGTLFVLVKFLFQKTQFYIV
jgi:uncharacterized membrane protein|tara:strand:+ start:136 stop:510 length:375 start_codon:yes stop_codon:yes gene_type:complete